jgi:hypothetical protein
VNRRLFVSLLAAAATVGGGVSSAAPRSARAEQRCCAIVELRQYTLHPDRFDPFVELFENEFLDPLDAAGMTVIGQFRDLDDPNRFVWLRGFADMPARARSLAAFYDGPVWKARRGAANDNFTDTDNVLLLHPTAANGGIEVPEHAPKAGARMHDRGMVVAAVYPLAPAHADAFPAYFDRRVRPLLAQAGVDVAATFETDAGPNNFPRLPVREGERVFVWLAKFASQERGERALHDLAASTAWREAIEPELRGKLLAAPQVLRLAPTARSRLAGR